MSFADKGGFNPGGAKAVKAHAAAWLERRDRADWTERDQAELDSWLAESTENYLFFHRVESAWARSQRLVVLRPSGQQVSTERTKAWRRPLSAAAVVALVIFAVLGVGGTLLFLLPEKHTFATSVGGHEIVTLRDGSSIELNTDTIVRADIGVDHRLASIERGEAYFKVAHDAGHPFIVTAGNSKITVLGTKFSIRNEPNRVEVKLIDGKVWFTSDNGKSSTKSAMMTPGDIVVATSDTFSMVKGSPIILADELSWRRGLLVFHHASLADAAMEYNRYSERKIVIADADAARLTVTGSLPANDAREFLVIAKKFFGLRVQSYGNEVVISR